MFWRFGFHNSSAIDALLDREDITLEHILEEEDLLQETKSHNQKLINLYIISFHIYAPWPFHTFFCKPENLGQLLNYITASDLDDSAKYKYPFLACEIIACEVPYIVDAIVLENKDLLESFWTFLDRTAAPRRRLNDTEKPITEETGLDPLQASYFCKTISVLLAKRTTEMIEFIRSKPDNLNKILAHLQTSAIMDLLLTLVRVEELPEGKGTVQWLSDGGLLENLVSRLDPYLDSEEHSIAQQCICEIIRMSQTSLLESPSIGVNDLIIDLKSEEMMQRLAGFMLDEQAPNSTSTLINGVTIIIDLIRHNNSDMDNEPMLNDSYGYSANQVVREASVSLADMLKVLADNVPRFNALLLKPKSVHGPMETSIGKQTPLGFERLKICELFAELLHCSNMSNLNSSLAEESSAGNGTDAVQPEKKENNGNSVTEEPKSSSNDTSARKDNADNDEKRLAIGDYLKQKFIEYKVMPTCVDGQLTSKIVEAQKANDIDAKPKGMRLGYMGHLSFIADEIIKLLEGYPETIVSAVKDDVDLDSWNAYCNNELRITRERDRLPLGGTRPNDELEAATDDEEEEDDDDSNQYPRYLDQRVIDSGMDEDEEDDQEHWIAGRDDYDYGYDGGFGMPTNNQGSSIPENGAPLEDEEYGSDDDEETGRVITDWTRGFSQFPHANTLRRTQSHTRENENGEDTYDDNDEYDHVADATEMERRAAFQGGNNKEDSEDEQFGEFTSSSDSAQWAITSSFDNLEITSDNNTKERQPELSEDNYVRAVKTKEEDQKGKADQNYYLEDEEQHGEV
ncbi:hypothetical protein EC973_009521 [Apophysomyces ossiformis]|uniref:SAPS-domain-containing protein n=1 Tax=Apophysomyces ossiformis TaxID=679940 RepID=A0A8H7ESX0_9FUNG|nr:hypothetical protein EC973_009521 [Apophysomyces ossiformis]